MGFIHQLETNYAFEISHCMNKGFPHIQKRILQKLLNGNTISDRQFWRENISGPKYGTVGLISTQVSKMNI